MRANNAPSAVGCLSIARLHGLTSRDRLARIAGERDGLCGDDRGHERGLAAGRPPLASRIRSVARASGQVDLRLAGPARGWPGPRRCTACRPARRSGRWVSTTSRAFCSTGEVTGV